jgi:hypothetical protein
MYVDFTANNKEYKLRLNTRQTVALEKALGCNPLAIFGNGDSIPTITQMVAILHSSLQAYHHGLTMVDAYDVFDGYLEDGNTITDFIPVILDIYRASGLIKDDRSSKDESEGKN